MNRKHETESYLPLSPLEYQILVALARQPSHGYGLLERVARDSEGNIQPAPGSLYASLKRLERLSYIKRIAELRAASPHPARIYELSAIGWPILEQETDRLQQASALATHYLARHDTQTISWASMLTDVDQIIAESIKARS